MVLPGFRKSGGRLPDFRQRLDRRPEFTDDFWLVRTLPGRLAAFRPSRSPHCGMGRRRFER
jgi:hypothetical protein